MTPGDRDCAELLWDALPAVERQAWADLCRLVGPDERRDLLLAAAGSINRIAGNQADLRGDAAALERAERRAEALLRRQREHRRRAIAAFRSLRSAPGAPGATA